MSTAATYGTGSVYQRSDGRWCASLMHNGKRRSVYAKTEREAKKKLVALQAEVGASGILAQPGRHTVEEVLVTFLDHKRRTVRDRTLADYEASATRHIVPALGSIRLSRLTPERISGWLDGLRRRGIGRQARMAYGVLRGALELAVRWGRLANNPCSRVDIPAYRAKRKEVWTTTELKRFLAETNTDWRGPLWVVAVLSGCRLGELLALRWEDTDLERKMINVHRSGQWIRGTWVEGEPKTRSGRRTISLPDVAVMALTQQRAQQGQWRNAAPTGPWDDNRVFTSHTGAPLDGPNLARALRVRCADIGVPEITPHSFRHLSASLLLQAGLTVTEVSARLGHASPSITLSIYAHVVEKNDQRAAEALARSLSG